VALVIFLSGTLSAAGCRSAISRAAALRESPTGIRLRAVGRKHCALLVKTQKGPLVQSLLIFNLLSLDV